MLINVTFVIVFFIWYYYYLNDLIYLSGINVTSRPSNCCTQFNESFYEYGCLCINMGATDNFGVLQGSIQRCTLSQCNDSGHFFKENKVKCLKPSENIWFFFYINIALFFQRFGVHFGTKNQPNISFKNVPICCFIQSTCI